MYPQTVKVALFDGDVASERFAVLFARVQMAAADTVVIADGHGQAVHDVELLFVGLFMNIGQQREHSLPERFWSANTACQSASGISCRRRLKQPLDSMGWM